MDQGPTWRIQEEINSDSLEACAVAGGLDFNSNQYIWGKLYYTSMFGGTELTNISVTEMYRFPGILLKMSLVFGDIEGYKSFGILWHTLIPPQLVK